MTLLELLNKDDRMAAANGMQLTEIREGFAKAEMDVETRHLNGGGVCQGGCLFTLADLAVAGVMNSQGLLTVGIENTIAFHNSGKLGDHLVAEATLTFSHHKLPYCEVHISNQEGSLIASCTALSYRKKAELAFDALM